MQFRGMGFEGVKTIEMEAEFKDWGSVKSSRHMASSQLLSQFSLNVGIR